MIEIFVEDWNLCLIGFPASGVLEYGRAKEKVLGLKRLIIRGSDTKAKLKIWHQDNFSCFLLFLPSWGIMSTCITYTCVPNCFFSHNGFSFFSFFVWSLHLLVSTDLFHHKSDRFFSVFCTNTKSNKMQSREYLI